MGEQLPASIKQVWRLHAVIWGGVWLVIALGLTVAHGLWHWPLWLAGIFLAIGLLHPLLQFSFIPYRYAFGRYLITETAVYLRSGFVFRKEEAVPISRIQNVTLEAGPLLASKGLQEVQIETASTQHSIAGVTTAVAGQLRDRIMQLAQEARDDA
ncbi:PH domain-containing protein [Lacticaseibacillus nasuensis]|uniref:PH domain-containing protein n=1 Tax=Lacticaseibacillus nasuensis TaxID=944671 RepID=UPI0006D1C6BC|nr:PH domain-containing protein [Lacticaseibacillus nasuensis]MCX2455828.1 PH domain-containing protein [Lacticaseibacillus nasuensis]